MKETIVAAGVIFKGGEVLLCKRPSDKPLEAGKWEFPGGKLEPGETAPQALRRELTEELNVHADVGRLLDVRLKTYGEKVLLLLFYECRKYEGELRATEHSQIRFVPADQVLSYDLADADRRAAQTIFSQKEKTDA